MPVFDVELVVAEDEQLDSTLARQLADQLGELMRTPTGRTWVRLRRLPLADYAENGVADVPHQVFVEVLKADLEDGTPRRELAEQISGCVARLCRRPAENVHVLFAPPGRGRVAFGGQLIE